MASTRYRIALLADPLDNQRGGVHTYTKELVSGLIRLGHETDWILIREKRDPHLQGVRQIAIPNIRVGLGLAALRLFFIVPLVLRFMRVDAVVEPAHFGPFNLPRRIKRITVIHDLTPILFPEYHRYHSQVLQNVFLASILKRADLVVANSRHTANDIARVYPFAASKVFPILLGYRPTAGPSAIPNVQFPFRVPERFWLSVGTIEPRKNLVRLLEAYSLFRDQHPDQVGLVIVGQRGWKSDQFDQALREHTYRQDILLTGFVDDSVLQLLYRQAIALIYPSLYEGFGLPVLEALSHGCPVICSDTSSLPEVGGHVARYVDPQRTDQVLEQMKAIYTMSPSGRTALGQACLDWASSFSWERHVLLFHQAMLAMLDGEPIGDWSVGDG